MARPSKTEIAQKRTLLIRPRFCRQAQQFQHFYVCSVASRTLLFSTSTTVYAIFCHARLSPFAASVHQRGEQQWRRKQRSKCTLRLRPHFCRQLCWPADATRLSILAHLFHHGNALAPTPLKGYGLLRSLSTAFNGPFLRLSNV